MKNLITRIKENKETVIKRTVVVGATFLGIALTAGLIKRRNDDVEELLTEAEALEEI